MIFELIIGGKMVALFDSNILFAGAPYHVYQRECAMVQSR